jgi:hypothetical protein
VPMAQLPAAPQQWQASVQAAVAALQPPLGAAQPLPQQQQRRPSAGRERERSPVQVTVITHLLVHCQSLQRLGFPALSHVMTLWSTP